MSKRGHRWWRRLLVLAIVLVLGLLAFHRPLTHWVVGIVVPRVSAKYGFPLTLKSSGSIWSDLRLGGVELGKDAPKWIESAEVDELAIEYDLRTLMARDFGQGIRSIKLHGVALQADLRLLPKSEEKRKPVDKTGSTPPPLIWPKVIDLDRISLDLILADGSRLIVRELRLQVFADRPGQLGFKELRLDAPEPNVPPVWLMNEVQAEVIRTGDVLTIVNLPLPYELVIGRLEVDLNEFSADEVGLTLALTRGVAALQGAVQLKGLFKPPLGIEADVELMNMRSGEWPELKLPADWRFEVGSIKGRAEGEVADLSKLAVTLELADGSAALGTYGQLDKVAAQIQLAEGALLVKSLDLNSGENALTLNGKMTLPGQMQEWAGVSWTVAAVADLPVLAKVVPAEFGVAGAVQFELNGSGRGVDMEALKANVRLASQALQFGSITVPGATAAFELSENTLQVESLEVEVGEGNQAVLSGMMALGAPRQVEGKWDIEVASIPDVIAILGIAEFGREITGQVVTKGEFMGSLDALRSRDFSKVTGTVSVGVNQVVVQPPTAYGPPSYGTARCDSIQAQAHFDSGRAILDAFEVVIDTNNQIHLTGETGLATPYEFEVSGLVDFSEVVQMNSLLAMVTTQRFSDGQIKMELRGEGEILPWSCQGDVNLTADKLRLDSMKDDLALVANAEFDGRLATLRKLSAEVGDWTLSVNGLIDAEQAKLSELSLNRGGVRLVDGRATVPFGWLGEGNTLPAEVDLRSVDLPLHEVLATLGVTGVPKAVVNAAVTAQGTVDALVADVDVALTNVKLTQVPADWGSGKLNLQAALAEGKATVEVLAEQAPLPVMTLKAAMPVDLRAVLADPGGLMLVPIEASLRVPETDLRFVKQFAPALLAAVPAVLRLEADLSGTLQRPSLRAMVDLDADEILLINQDLPSVRNVRVRLRSEDQLIRIEEASMVLAGGGVRLTGEVGIQTLQNPTLNLNFTAREALVYRDPTVSVRADADLTCRGDLAAATVAGEIAIVRGRVFKEIDVAPALRLPTSAPALPPDPARTGATINLPPFLTDWNFDVRLRTREPVLLTGNLFNGAISADLKLAGTGGDPQPTGVAKVERFLLRLPFSTIKVTSGTITLNPERPSDPQLDIRAESRMSSHFITIFAFGPLSNLKTRFTSSPPMREPDIATLLATGTTLSGDGAQVASEAVVRSLYLYVSEFYRKTFNKKKVIREEPPRLSVGLAPSNVGADRAGEAMQAIYDLNDRWRVVGQFARSGRVRVALGFLIRFGKSPPSEQSEAPSPQPPIQP